MQEHALSYLHLYIDNSSSRRLEIGALVNLENLIFTFYLKMV